MSLSACLFILAVIAVVLIRAWVVKRRGESGPRHPVDFLGDW